MGNTKSFIAATLMTAGLYAGVVTTAFAAGHSNPVDELSNPDARDFTDVEVGRQDYNESFVRDGVVIEPERFATIKPGLEQAQILSLLGEPLRQQSSQDLVWDYNFKFRLQQSQNFMVCQYKVVFDEQQVVRDTVWRRRQCQDLAGTQSAVK